MSKYTPSSLLRNSTIVFGGNSVANVTNYLYNIVMARFLGPELFAALAALLATMTVIGVPVQAILLGFTKFAADLESAQARGKLKYLWLSALQVIGALGFLLALVAILFVGPITRSLNIDAPLPFILLMISIPIGLLVAVNRGIAQGLERFWAYALSISAEGIAKVGFGILFVYGGYQLVGATGAVLAASLVAFLSLLPSLWPLTKIESIPFARRELLRFSFFTLAITLVITLFLNVDVIVAKAFLDGDAAGHYAAASTVAKIIPYIVSAVVSAMLPRIAQLVTKGEQHTGVLTEAMVLTGGVGIAIYALYLLIPTKILGILYGSLYLDAAPLLATLGGAMFIYAISNVLLTYFLSTKDARVLWSLCISTIGLFAFITLGHNTAQQLATALLSASGLLLVSLGITYALTRHKT